MYQITYLMKGKKIRDWKQRVKKINILQYYIYTNKHHNLFHGIFLFSLLISESKCSNSQIILITTLAKVEHRVA